MLKTALLGCALIGALPAFCQSPHASGPDVESGGKLFAKHCTACHGMNAKVGRAPDLTTGDWAHGSATVEIIRNIRQGIEGTQMPGFPVSEEQADSIVSWLRGLQADTGVALKGDPKAGQQVFFGAGGCSACHMVKGQGGKFGPDLTNVRNKGLDFAKHIHGVDLRLKNGTNARGIVIGEDTFSLYLRDSVEKLDLIRKQDIQSRTEATKGIGALSATDGGNVLAFLRSPGTFEPSHSDWQPAADFNVSFDRLKNSSAEPQNWLSYWGDLRGTHYSGLKAITPANVSKLAAQWTFQFGGSSIETTPIVAEGLMFVTGPLNAAAALDARTGHPIWRYRRPLPEVHKNCTVMTNRGFAVLGDRLYLATLDTHLVSLDAKTGNVIFDIE